MSLAGGGTAPRAPKLLAQVRRAIRVRHYSRRTEEAYVQWIRRFVRFHGLKRSEEHTSELQSQSNLVCRLLLEKKKRSHRFRRARCRPSRRVDQARAPLSPPHPAR